MPVPFLDLATQHAPLREEILSTLGEIIDKNAFASGPWVAAFEADYAKYCQTAHAIGVGTGTDALWLTLLAMDIGTGDEVITVPHTFIATAEAITYSGAKPVFVDIDATTANLDPSKLEAVITPRTKAIMPVHLYGQMADMEPILEVARRHGLKVIEDASQAHGAEYKGARAGSMGDAGCFSFYPGKNLGAFGEAGAVVTDNADLADRIRMLRDHGQAKKYHHSKIGWNSRMDGFQGAVLQIKLRHLETWTETRRQAARAYNALMQDTANLICPVEAPDRRHVYHIYAVRVPNRDEFMSKLGEKGIGCGIHYPIPLHLQEAYRELKLAEGAFPVSEQWAKECVSLPMHPCLTESQVKEVATAVSEAVS